MFKVTKFGADVVLVISVICFIVFLLSLFINSSTLRLLIVVPVFAFFIFTLYFFRDPERVTPMGENLIISPADGEICMITEIKDEKNIRSDAIQVSIFMSPFNVHVNRNPISGIVFFKKYIPGKFHVAYVDKASELNEQTLICMENDKIKIAMKQIAGYVARRIITKLEVGDSVRIGERFGMIKFGSRVDVIVPNRVLINVKKGDKVSAGETVLGTYN